MIGVSSFIALWLFFQLVIFHCCSEKGTISLTGSCIKDDAGADVGRAVAGLHRAGADL